MFKYNNTIILYRPSNILRTLLSKVSPIFKVLNSLASSLDHKYTNTQIFYSPMFSLWSSAFPNRAVCMVPKNQCPQRSLVSRNNNLTLFLLSCHLLSSPLFSSPPLSPPLYNSHSSSYSTPHKSPSSTILYPPHIPQTLLPSPPIKSTFPHHTNNKSKVPSRHHNVYQ